MCRLFCSLSAKESSPYKEIFESEYSILRQSKEEGHNDGWGVAAYRNGNLQMLARSTSPLKESTETASALVKAISSNCTGFFIRNASNPLNLDRKMILTLEATQPFTYKNIMFMHNGSINAPDKVMESARGFGMLPLSHNDSEAYFIVFIKYFFELNDASKAFAATEGLITNSYKGSSTSEKPFAFSSMNAIVSDGSKVYAFNRYTGSVFKGVSDPKRDFYKMVFQANGSSLLVASEPTNSGKWEEIGNGRLLEAWIEGSKIKYKVKTIQSAAKQ